MNDSKSNSQLAKLVADLEEDIVLELVQQRLEAGDDPLKIIDECNQGMRDVGLLSTPRDRDVARPDATVWSRG